MELQTVSICASHKSRRAVGKRCRAAGHRDALPRPFVALGVALQTPLALCQNVTNNQSPRSPGRSGRVAGPCCRRPRSLQWRAGPSPHFRGARVTGSRQCRAGTPPRRVRHVAATAAAQQQCPHTRPTGGYSKWCYGRNPGRAHLRSAMLMLYTLARHVQLRSFPPQASENAALNSSLRVQSSAPLLWFPTHSRQLLCRGRHGQVILESCSSIRRVRSAALASGERERTGPALPSPVSTLGRPLGSKRDAAVTSALHDAA